MAAGGVALRLHAEKARVSCLARIHKHRGEFPACRCRPAIANRWRHRQSLRNEFPWGKQWPPPNSAGNYADQSAKRRGATTIESYNDTFRETSPVGSFKPTAR